MTKCPHAIEDPTQPYCHAATKISGIVVPLQQDMCQECAAHPFLPQSVNAIVCGAARLAQIQAGLEPDPKLFDCMKSEQLEVDPELLKAAHQHWFDLHTFALKSWQPEAVRCYYKHWVETIPEFGCGCAEHWKEITQIYPIVFDRWIDWFVSTWYAHNMVNLSLFKPWFSLKQAKEIWMPHVVTNLQSQ
jgi:hypothetical protein